MPKTVGSPITISNGQPQREVSHFNVSVSYDTADVPSFQFNAFGTVRLRDSNGVVVYEEQQKNLISLADAQLPANVKTSFIAIVSRLDTI